MQEYQVTVDGISYPVPEPFMVLATQNPIEFAGTYPAGSTAGPFYAKVDMGYPDPGRRDRDPRSGYTGAIG